MLNLIKKTIKLDVRNWGIKGYKRMAKDESINKSNPIKK